MGGGAIQGVALAHFALFRARIGWRIDAAHVYETHLSQSLNLFKAMGHRWSFLSCLILFFGSIYFLNKKNKNMFG